MKKSIVFFLGIAVAIALMIYGAVMKVPEKYVWVSSSSAAYNYSWERNTGAQYLGGDAYNYQVEASLKAGYLSGVFTVKSVTIVGGILLLFVSLFGLMRNLESEKQTRLLQAIADAASPQPVTAPEAPAAEEKEPEVQPAGEAAPAEETPAEEAPAAEEAVSE